MQERDLDLNKEEKLKHELRNTLEKAYPGLDFSINGLKLKLKGFYPNSTTYSLEIDAHLSERVDVINLTNMPIKHSTIKQLEWDRKKHGYKELTTMVADVLEKHYEQN